MQLDLILGICRSALPLGLSKNPHGIRNADIISSRITNATELWVKIKVDSKAYLLIFIADLSFIRS